MPNQNAINKKSEDFLISKSSGDPFINFDLVGTQDFTAGIDDSDGDKFKITDSTSPSTGNEIITIDPASSNAIKFNNAYEFPTTDGTANYVLATDGAGNVDWQLNSASGKIVQQVYTFTNTFNTYTAIIPFDDTIPQQTEGNQILSLSITPININNILTIEAQICGNATANSTWAFFQDTTANALNAGGLMQSSTSVDIDTWHFNYRMVAGTTSSTTIKLRVGVPTIGQSFYLNGIAVTGRKYGGVMISYLKIIEFLP